MPCVVFVIEELQNSAHDVAKHRCGCRIVCRLVEHAAELPGTRELVDQLLDPHEIGGHINHAFSNYVVSMILEHGNYDQKEKVVEELMRNLEVTASHRHSSRVVEAAVVNAPPELSAKLVAALKRKPGLANLAQNRFGVHVVKSILRAEKDSKGDLLIAALQQANMFGSKQTKHCKQLINALQNQRTPS